MDGTEQTIIEQEFESFAQAAWLRLQQVVAWFDANLLTLASAYQLVAIAVTLALAWLLHSRFKRLLQELGQGRKLAPAVQRLLRTVASISMPVVWVIFLALARTGFESAGMPIPFLRLVSSLLLAFIVINIISIFIASTYWSRVFSWVAWGAAALNAVGLLDVVIEWLQATALTVGAVEISAWSIVKALILAALLLWGANAVTGTVERRLEHTGKMSSALRLLVVRLLRLVLLTLAVIVAIAAVGIDLTAFAIFSGALGVGVGLALRRTFENLIASYSLLADESIKPGDVIEIETVSGPTYGQVRKMTTRYVAVMTRDGTETLIPNELLMSSPLTNWSHTAKPIRRRVPVGVAYSADIPLAQRLCVEAAGEVLRVLAHPEPRCLMRGFGDSAIDLELRFWINDPENGVANVTSDVLLLIWEKFQAHGIEVPFPQRDVTLRGPVRLDTPP
ncbi:mechanosensitive ion channel [Dinoroseobacter sp. PD6]|uniref:mechanosensitive ion channel family protein n=1 Tax=Dinoroseobacter sp. PD6 TaxID=3028384 RepID=UPI00237B3930|nr:mechanosensitive ion channel domain-containing protein [Dinoroseobacter sp. PD6]MDD9715342.1 mechanosensitive ion channel [Dinoroseobacter sp. PD6]